MTSHSGKNPLPSGPATLCFNKEEFLKDDLNVDKFVLECRRRVSMETLRDDLTVYLKVLKTAMIELINKDYADFVNLSTNLVGMDKAIGNLTVPLGQLKEEVLSVRMAIDESIRAVEEKLAEQARIRDRKACLQRLISITYSVDKIEKLLGIQQTEGNYTGELSGQLIERVATEFNKLQFYVNKSRGLPLVEQIKPRIANITTSLQYSLEGSFKEGLEKGQVEVLRQCLRTYALIDKMKDAEALFRQHMVKPYMEEVINEQFIRSNPHGLRGMFAKVLDFIPKHCKKLKEVTGGALHSSGGGDVVRGYDFLVNAVWPEVVNNIEARTPSIFAPGNPEMFHEKYGISMEFVSKFEQQCGSQASVLRLREHPSYNTFITKWSLPVYFQIRFQEIAGAFETALSTPFNSVQDGSGFMLLASQSVWESLQKCWRDNIYLQPLCHRFWKLTLQLFARYVSWLQEVKENEIVNKKSNGDSETAAKQGTGEPAAVPEAQVAPPITMTQIVYLIADAEHLMKKIPELFDETIKPHIQALGFQDLDILRESLMEAVEGIRENLPPFDTYITDEITAQCAVHLKLVSDIPRLYRRTNREKPSKASGYVSGVRKPIAIFLEEHQEVKMPKRKEAWVTTVLRNLTQQYLTITSDVLTSVKKMEDSLKRLKKARGGHTSSGSQGMSDDDKIRLQFEIDVKGFGDQIQSLDVEKENVEEYVKLLDVVVSARSSPASS